MYRYYNVTYVSISEYLVNCVFMGWSLTLLTLDRPSTYFLHFAPRLYYIGTQMYEYIKTRNE